MNKSNEERFEHSFDEAVKASLRAGACGESARARLLEALALEAQAPGDLSLAELERFEDALSQAVSHSQDWACEDEVAHKVESALCQQSGQDLLSERSVHAAASEDSAKARYLAGFRDSLRRSQESVVARPECRRRIEEAVAAARHAEVPAAASPVVVPFRPRGRWDRAYKMVTSMVAGFALLFVFFWGSADRALADTVRKDHKLCCSALRGNVPSHCQSVKDSGFGPVPQAVVASGWTLVASKICQGEDGQTMVHNVYVRSEKIMSIHLFPPQSGDRETTRPYEIGADESFPVMVWELQGWTVTACSDELSPSDLASAVMAQ